MTGPGTPLVLAPIGLGGHLAPNRVMFGPHVTNLGTDEREFSERHVAYYERRAQGGCGIIVTEGASVHESDWPYERAPLASVCERGWSDIVAACHPHGSLVIAALDHAGGQGSSAYSQAPLWAPARVPEVNTREVPKWMEPEDIAAVVDGFGAATTTALRAGCDGVEINAGQHSLIRQFLSGLTNHRSDEWGTDRLHFARQVVMAVRAAADAVAPGSIIGLRLSCDELAPWAGITPEMAPEIARELVALGLHYVVVVRGSIFSVEQTRPDFHVPSGFNVELCRTMKANLATHAPDVAIILQGSVTDIDQASWAVSRESGPVCDAVEMTRAQITDPDLVAKTRRGDTSRIRPCIRCNQTCQVRDARNPIVSCVAEPTSGHETRDPDWYRPASSSRRVLVMGAGPAGLEAARVAATRGHRVTVWESADEVGGVARVAGPGAAFVAWLKAELGHLGVGIECGVARDRCIPVDTFDAVIQATGSVPGTPDFPVEGGAELIDVADLHRGTRSLPSAGPVVILDPIGGPIGVAIAETLGARAVLITPDNIAGNELSRTGDLAPANVRLAQGGVTIERRSVVRAVQRVPGTDTVAVVIQDRFSGQERVIEAVAVIDAGFRLPSEPLGADRSPDAIDGGIGGRVVAIGDCVAPRTILEAVLEARRAAHSL
ncbi:MAG: mycofactocin system FadH/OYE family oxidoreductase 1 [Ilumatobacteraceae bacterium]